MVTTTTKVCPRCNGTKRTGVVEVKGTGIVCPECYGTGEVIVRVEPEKIVPNKRSK